MERGTGVVKKEIEKLGGRDEARSSENKEGKDRLKDLHTFVTVKLLDK